MQERLTSEGEILIRFAVWLAVSEKQGRLNAPNHPNWTWTLNSQKYFIYTK